MTIGLSDKNSSHHISWNQTTWWNIYSSHFISPTTVVRLGETINDWHIMFRPLWAEYINTMVPQCHHISIRVSKNHWTTTFSSAAYCSDVQRKHQSSSGSPHNEPKMGKVFACPRINFFVCTQPMRDDISMKRHLLLAGHIHKMTPACHDLIISYHNEEKWKYLWSFQI